MRCWIALHTSITTDPGIAMLDEAEAQHVVASMALGFTPRVALVDEAVLMDVTGSLRLFGGLARLMASPCASLIFCNRSRRANLMSCDVSSLIKAAGVPGRGLYKKLKL